MLQRLSFITIIGIMMLLGCIGNHEDLKNDSDGTSAKQEPTYLDILNDPNRFFVIHSGHTYTGTLIPSENSIKLEFETPISSRRRSYGNSSRQNTAFIIHKNQTYGIYFSDLDSANISFGKVDCMGLVLQYFHNSTWRPLKFDPITLSREGKTFHLKNCSLMQEYSDWRVFVPYSDDFEYLDEEGYPTHILIEDPSNETTDFDFGEPIEAGGRYLHLDDIHFAFGPYYRFVPHLSVSTEVWAMSPDSDLVSLEYDKMNETLISITIYRGSPLFDEFS